MAEKSIITDQIPDARVRARVDAVICRTAREAAGTSIDALKTIREIDSRLNGSALVLGVYMDLAMTLMSAALAHLPADARVRAVDEAMVAIKLDVLEMSSDIDAEVVRRVAALEDPIGPTVGNA